jgi:hypothetical protein
MVRMTADELRAIRERNEERKSNEDECREHNPIHRGCGSDCTGNDCVAASTADIDALLAEVERLHAFAATVKEQFGVWPADEISR